ncbi:hypothetical protein NM04_01770 [Massilia aurea]|uniref:MFS transporter permease n=2 Tax=Massilia TaxID=149698 RepID=A0A422QR98_9BURK|nr:DUF6064 family protein [Massilia aurea]RNF32466.1 hypothetical protein NM04_01770 [Massilia aurea]
MSEWWTYTLSDFLMFSQRSYYRLIALYNEAVWPAHLLALAAGLIVIGCIARPGAHTRRIALLVLAMAWGWVGWAYHLERYADINTAGPWFALAFGVQSVMLCFMALRSHGAVPAGTQKLVALGLSGLAVLGYPLLALGSGRGWHHAEVFGIAPDPTAVATLGALLACRAHPLYWLIPLAWCAVSGATLMELRVGYAWLLPTFAILAVAAGLLFRQSRH